MKLKYPLLILLSCSLTIFNQVVYRYIPASDSIRYLNLAKEYNNLTFFDPISNCYGHQFYALFLSIVGGLISYNQYVVGITQTLIFCLSVIFLIKELEVYYKGKSLLSLSIIVFIIPEMQIYNGYLLTESLAFSLLILVFGMALRIYNRKASFLNILFISLIIGCTILNRVECAVCILPIVYFLFPRIKQRLILQLLTLLSIPIFMFVLNMTLNCRIYNVTKITSFNGGEVIYGGNNENLDGSHHAFEQLFRRNSPKTGCCLVCLTFIQQIQLKQEDFN
jgi:hypothetical protein